MRVKVFDLDLATAGANGSGGEFHQASSIFSELLRSIRGLRRFCRSSALSGNDRHTQRHGRGRLPAGEPIEGGELAAGGVETDL